MSATAAQAIWCQWPLAERLALLARWQARQSLVVRSGLSQLPDQAPAANDKTTSRLPDGRRQLAAFGPLGVVELTPESNIDASHGLAHMAWACALGNSLIYRTDDALVKESIDSLRELLISADSALEDLLQVQLDCSEKIDARRSLSEDVLYMLVAPSADLPLLVKDALHASRVSGVVLCVNHSLHHEVERRLPKQCNIESIDDIQQSLQAGDLYLTACGAVIEALHQLQAKKRSRAALYSGDWAEIEAACDSAAARGAAFAVNTVDAPPLGLTEARSLYQQPSLTVIAHAAQ